MIVACKDTVIECDLVKNQIMTHDYDSSNMNWKSYVLQIVPNIPEFQEIEKENNLATKLFIYLFIHYPPAQPAISFEITMSEDPPSSALGQYST